MQVLGRNLSFEDIFEVGRQPEVDVVEVRHVSDVVDDLAAVGTFDEHRVPVPAGPFIAGLFRNLGNADPGLGRVAFMVVPDEQQARAHIGVPGTGPRQLRSALGIGNQLAAAVAAPAPVVERAGHLVALDGALAQVAAHVAAVAVEHLDVALGVGEDHQFGAERLDPVWLAVQEVLRDAQAVPAAGKPRRQSAGINLPDADRSDVGSHLSPPIARL